MKNNEDANSAKQLDTEEGLIQTASHAVNQCRWVVGECAARWTKKYAKGRTDADFAALIGVSGDQVFQRRRVWETFSDVRETYLKLKWSHFYAALNWDDAPECLTWAEETDATVAEMKAWRRALRGEDLTTAAEEDEAGIAFVPDQPTFVQDPDEFGNSPSSTGNGADGEQRGGKNISATAAARQKDEKSGEYSPFRQGAITPPSQETASEESTTVLTAPPVAQIVKRMTKSLQRYEAAITPEFVKLFRSLPEQTQSRFIKAVGDLSSKTAELL